LTALADGGAAASAALLPQIRALLKRAELGYADLDAVAFGQGPGAFTGLRTACAVAQGLALAIGKPLLPIDSLMLVAEDARTQTGALEIVVLMTRAWTSLRWPLRLAGRRWTVLQAPALYALHALPALWPHPPSPCSLVRP
jgi:tRNA threonylcarbamoyladenosine biosynthesis protein TsaB